MKVSANSVAVASRCPVMSMSSRTVVCGEMVMKRGLRRYEQPSQGVAGFSCFSVISARRADLPRRM